MSRKRLTLAVAALAAASVAFGAEQKRIDDGRALVGTMYFPMCRTEGPDKSEWPKDIAKMKELGYQCLHGFCEWSRIEKEKGVYDFSDVDLLLDLCAKNGIVCLVNIAVQNTVGYHMPTWMENEYRGRGLVDVYNRGIPFKSIHSVPCLDDPWYRAEAEKYLNAIADHYKGDRRVAGWVLWGEPMLESEYGKPLCFCEHTVAKFRTFLEKKYGTVEKLNKAWSTEGPVAFASFADVRPPAGPTGHKGGYAAWADWGAFMPGNFGANIKWADDLLKRRGATQPTIIEMFCYPSGGGVVNDVWELGKSADIIGASCFVRPGVDVELALTVANSVAARENKSVFIVEQLGGTKGYNYDRTTANADELQSEAAQAIGLGSKGLMYWTWRPRFTDYEAGTFGLCRADGKPLRNAYAGGRQAAAFSELGTRLASAERRPQVGVLHMSGAVFSKEDGTSQELLHGEMGAIRVFLDAHVTPQVVNEQMIREGLPPHLKALVLPFAYSLDAETCAGIRRFVERGGCVIADVNLAFKQPDGRAWRNLPGGGLDRVFGFEKDEVQKIDDECLLPKENPYGIKTGTYVDLVTPTTAEIVVGDRERPLELRNCFGKGEARAFTFLAFAQYQRDWGNVAFKRHVLEILKPFGVEPFVAMKEVDDRPWPDVSVAELVRADGTKVITFTNSANSRKKWETRAVDATFPGATRVAKLWGEGVEVKAEGGRAQFTLRPWQSVMLEVR